MKRIFSGIILIMCFFVFADDANKPETTTSKLNVKDSLFIQLQDEVDKNSDFNSVKTLLDYLIQQEELSKSRLYLSLFEHYATSDTEKAWLFYYRARLSLLQQDYCRVQEHLNHLQKMGYKDQYEMLISHISDRSLTSRDGYYDCDLLQIYNMMKSRGLKRSNSVHLDIKFETDSDELEPVGVKQLMLLKDTLSHINMAGLELHIVGHADERGTQSYNLQLSKRRAFVIEDFLLEQTGLSAKQIVSTGLGETQPLEPGSSLEAFALNRRVELYFVSITTEQDEDR